MTKTIIVGKLNNNYVEYSRFNVPESVSELDWTLTNISSEMNFENFTSKTFLDRFNFENFTGDCMILIKQDGMYYNKASQNVKGWIYLSNNF